MINAIKEVSVTSLVGRSQYSLRKRPNASPQRSESGMERPREERPRPRTSGSDNTSVSCDGRALAQVPKMACRVRSSYRDTSQAAAQFLEAADPLESLVFPVQR